MKTNYKQQITQQYYTIISNQQPYLIKININSCIYNRWHEKWTNKCTHIYKQ